jgi:putative SOS response-associated peptidase YedK
MCANYVPVTSGDHMLTFFGVERDFKNELPPEAFPLGFAPFIRRAPPGSEERRVAEQGMFGLLPGFTKDLAFGRRTYNARTETVHELPSFREAWRTAWLPVSSPGIRTMTRTPRRAAAVSASSCRRSGRK